MKLTNWLNKKEEADKLSETINKTSENEICAIRVVVEKVTVENAKAIVAFRQFEVSIKAV